MVNYFLQGPLIYHTWYTKSKSPIGWDHGGVDHFDLRAKIPQKIININNEVLIYFFYLCQVQEIAGNQSH